MFCVTVYGFLTRDFVARVSQFVPVFLPFTYAVKLQISDFCIWDGLRECWRALTLGCLAYCGSRMRGSRYFGRLGVTRAIVGLC